MSVSVTSLLHTGQIIGGPSAAPAAAPAEAPACVQNGIKATFYDVTAGQASPSSLLHFFSSVTSQGHLDAKSIESSHCPTLMQHNKLLLAVAMIWVRGVGCKHWKTAIRGAFFG